jgi:hypothetical protein
MDKQYFGKLIAFLFLSFKILIIPLLFPLTVLIKSKTIKDDIKKAGNIYYKKDYDNKKNIISKFYPYLFVILLLFLKFSILMRDWFHTTIVLSFIILFTSLYIYNKKYNNIYGIYENGVINADKELFEWKNIQSYKINENNISGYCKDGSLFEFNNLENIDEIRNLFEKNRVMKRDN